MANKSVITYIPPKSNFVMVSNSIVDKYDAEVVGVYCKIVKLSSGKSLSIDFISKKIKISDGKVRKIIVLLENDGYIVRDAIRNEKGHISRWNYCLYSEPVPKSQRSHAGKKDKKEESNLPKNQQVGKPTCRESNMLENGEDNILLSDIEISSNNEDFDFNNNKRLSDDNQKGGDVLIFEKYMKEHYPYIMKMDKPLTLNQATELKKDFGEEIVLEVFTAMDNYKPLLKKYRDAYRVARNWCERRSPEKKEVQI